MFSRGSQSGYVLLVDVGSGSVGLAITGPDQNLGPIWEYREQVPLKVTTSVQESGKAVVTAIVNAIFALENYGRTALTEHAKSVKITNIQVTVSAPWSYTVARTVRYSQDESFTITEELLRELATAAADQAMEEFSAEHSLQELGVTETSRTTLDTHANGYRITSPNKQTATQLAVTHVSTLVREDIVASVKEMQTKLFPHATVSVTSFMLANYYVTDSLQPVGTDFCLVDITNEATELGIVRHNALQYVTHIPYGRTSIAREVAAATKAPLHEAFTGLRTLSQEKKLHDDIAATLAAYQELLIELFKETGDRLSIPKRIFLETDTSLGEFFSPLIDAAGKEASKSNVLVHITTPKFIQKGKAGGVYTDTPLAVAAAFFHTKDQRPFFEYL